MKIVVTMSMTLDGVTQAPGRSDEDPRDGFRHGGWATPYADQVMGQAMGERMAAEGALLLGRRTYEALYAFWPRQTDGNPFTEKLNRTRKYVASRTLPEPLPWVNSTLVSGDLLDSVAQLKAGEDGTLSVIGSVDVVRQLMRRHLIDEYLLLIHPLVLGSGRRLFADDDTVEKLRLVDSLTTTTGVIIGTYRPA